MPGTLRRGELSAQLTEGSLTTTEARPPTENSNNQSYLNHLQSTAASKPEHPLCSDGIRRSIKHKMSTLAHSYTVLMEVSASSRPLLFSSARRMDQSFSKSSTSLPSLSQPRPEVEVSLSSSMGLGEEVTQRT